MTIYELAQSIPNGSPNKELILLVALYGEVHKLLDEVRRVEYEIDSMEE